MARLNLAETLAPRTFTEDLDGSNLSIGITVSRFNSEITERLLAGALRALPEVKIQADRVVIAWVPGAFELPYAARRLAEGGRFDAIVCLGCVIKGETEHNEYINQQTSRGIAEVAVSTGIPTIFGVITPNNLEQALARSEDGTTNKGYEAVLAGVTMANLRRHLAGS